jgi:hypothetical protein
MEAHMKTEVWTPTPRDKSNYQHFVLYLIGAVTAFATATVLLAENIIRRGPLAWALVAATVVLAVMAVRGYVVFLRNAEELLQRIHLGGLALGFGAAAVFMPCWRLLERLGAPKLDVNDALVVMMLFWVLGLNHGFKRYSGEAE